MNALDLDIPTLLDNLDAMLKQEIERRHLNDPLMIGIHTGGAWIAEKLHQRLGLNSPLGLLDISFYRDDFSEIGMHPKVKPSRLPPTIEGRDVVLVDDVLFTGRTIRAALNEIFDYGRPNQVILAVLIERDGRQIPIQADCIGAKIKLRPGQRIKLTGPDPLGILIQNIGTEAA
ncbi:MAG: bifunctional pyr operon transcriptional regulator/uracil phosphoribosyltransferase PyrR [Pseudomonadota bacterium]